MKKIFFVLGILCIFIILVLFYFNKKHTNATIDNHTFFIEIAKTQQEQEIGLSKYTSLPQENAMYFPFEKTGLYSFWMKGMHFPIDILFLQKNKIVTIFSDVPVKTDYQNYTYQPTQPVNAVLEINAGLSKKYGFKIGDSVIISY